MDTVPDIVDTTPKLNPYVPLTNTEVDFARYTTLLFVNHGAADTDLHLHCNSNTYAILYDLFHDSDSIMDYVKQFSNVKRIGFAFHGQPTGTNQYIPHLFINGESLFHIDDVSNNNSDLSKNMLFVIELIQHFTLDNLDFLGCNLLKNTVWTQYLDVLQKQTNTIIGASDDNTGNIKYGGDWVLETTMENVKNIYFDESINNYANLLATIAVDGFTYITNDDNNTAKISASTKSGSVVIPSSVTNNGIVYTVNNIARFSFYNKHGVTSFTIPASITTIERQSLLLCVYCTSITFEPNSQLTYIGSEGLGGLSSLVSFEIPSGVTYIGDSALGSAVKLTSPIIIPSGVTFLGSHVFLSALKVPSITFAPNSLLTTLPYGMCWNTRITEFTVPKGITFIAGYAFRECYDLETVTFETGSELITIDNEAFSRCPSLASISIPPSVTTIGNAVFSGSSNLASITLSEGLTSIGQYAFNGGVYTDVIIPTTVTTIGKRAFVTSNPLNSLNVTLTSELQAIYGVPSLEIFYNFETVTFTNDYPEQDTSIVLDDSVKEAVKNAVPTVTSDGSDIITIPTLSDPTIFSSGTISEKRSKRKVFFKDFFTKNSAVITGKTIKMNKETLLGESSIISKPNVQVMKAENTETPVDTSSLASDEGIYAFIDSIGDFIVLQMGTDKKLKVEKLNDTEYNIYEDYVGENSQVTSIMSEGQHSSYNDFGYQIGSFSGPTDPSLIPVPICFPAGTPVMTDQGNIHIDKIKPNINTINGKCIIDITVTIPNFENMICIEEGALGMNSPSLRTEISPDHCVLYNGEMRKAIELTEVCDKVNKIPHNNEKLYNVLMEKHDIMCINNMICETLHPDNILVEVIRDSELSNKDKTYLFKKYEQLLQICK